MGVVYDAWQNSVDRQVALKVLPAGIAADTKSVTRFIREAKTAAQLHHPSVVSVYGMGVEANTPYYAMLTGQSPRRNLPS
jgi:serine/threonine protein kinase